MATWGDQTCQRFEATVVGFETGLSRLRVRPSNRYAIAPHKLNIMIENIDPHIIGYILFRRDCLGEIA